MKHIIILGDGMADHAVERLGGKTLLQYAHTPNMDDLAEEGCCGRLMTIPDGFQPGSEVANSTILGYDQNKVYEGRGPLEAASIGYEIRPEDLALRCNIIEIEDGIIKNHHGGHLTTEEGDMLVNFLNEKLAMPINEDLKEKYGIDNCIRFITGIQYRHLLIIRGGNKHIVCAPPHDHPNEDWEKLLVKAEKENEAKKDADTLHKLSAEQTAEIINELIIRSQELLAVHPFNAHRSSKANSIWPWSGGYRPSMKTLMEKYPQITSGSCISAVDLIRGIGHYAGLDIVKVPGATGLANTNYEGKAQAAIEALKRQDFVFLHLEASDEAGHDGDLDLKLKTIEDLDSRIVGPIFNTVKRWEEPVCIAVLPDHPTPVEIRTHVKEPVPFLIWYKGITPDEVNTFDEVSCVRGSYGMLYLTEFMDELMKIE